MMFDEGEENDFLTGVGLTEDSEIEDLSDGMVYEVSEYYSLSWLFDSDMKLLYYDGSLTTPPCDEILWVISYNVQTASKAQIASFPKELVGYVRDIQTSDSSNDYDLYINFDLSEVIGSSSSSSSSEGDHLIDYEDNEEIELNKIKNSNYYDNTDRYIFYEDLLKVEDLIMTVESYETLEEEIEELDSEVQFSDYIYYTVSSSSSSSDSETTESSNEDSSSSDGFSDHSSSSDGFSDNSSEEAASGTTSSESEESSSEVFSDESESSSESFSDESTSYIQDVELVQSFSKSPSPLSKVSAIKTNQKDKKMISEPRTPPGSSYSQTKEGQTDNESIEDAANKYLKDIGSEVDFQELTKLKRSLEEKGFSFLELKGKRMKVGPTISEANRNTLLKMRSFAEKKSS